MYEPSYTPIRITDNYGIHVFVIIKYLFFFFHLGTEI